VFPPHDELTEGIVGRGRNERIGVTDMSTLNGNAHNFQSLYGL
jgi:hypothetical protein